ncbi:mono/diheme cytochrome c family protein [Bradyrhizobium elkanii]|uniref:hypothetical protein n=1 Tax=Bradyrhizobium TaxID=374 RepID=UPI0021672AB4|nr:MULTISPECIES: hypothetical protein [Bradyrhizobium]MCS3928880.1 mono/diheme cytochrome c family protein [Bradyrhizobium elkanii]MCS3969434.1 mono/diheme cytochrome c family protein [Bradyrhizobium japonicum]
MGKDRNTSVLNCNLQELERTLPAMRAAPSRLHHGAYAWLLSDKDIADVVSVIQTSWGNRGAVAASSNVTALRQSTRE